MHHQLISIVISAFNEEGNVTKLYQELVKVANKEKHTDFEFLFVDDGSSDNTYTKCLQLQKKDKRVRVVQLVRNFGHEIAMTAGMDAARGDAVIFMDCDLQHPPKYIPEMLRLWRKGHKIVLTKRVDNKGTSRTYKACASLFYSLLNRISDIKIRRNEPDFRLIDRKYIDLLKQFNERDRLFRGFLSWIHPKEDIATIAFTAPARYSGKTKYSLMKSLSLALSGILQFSVLPLRLATCFGLLAAICAGVLGLYTLIEYFAAGKHTPGYASIMLVVIFLGAIQLVCLGIIGEYIGKIHMEVKKRPLYFVNTPDEEKEKK
ncbi:MAG: glycosyltransferase family 2 protein [Alphaproteobacteria bacterium]|nr:glycosyltransferase family 2 protein [Alphaproteobacteria bacterium]